MGRFDDGERHAIKVLDPEGYLRWQLPGLDPDLEFYTWLESQTASLSGTQLRGDCVAGFQSASYKGPRWGCLIEAQGQAKPNIVHRMTIALLLLDQNLRYGKSRDRFQMMGAILNLSKHKLKSSLDWTPPLVCPPPPAPLLTPLVDQPTEPAPALPYPAQRHTRRRRYGVRVRLFIRNVRWENGWATLADIGAGRTALCILIWVPMMLHGDDPELIALWCRLVLRVKPSWMRSDIIELAKLFAEMAKRQALWLPVLRRFDVRESKVAMTWVNQGLEKGAKALRGTVLSVLQFRFPDVAIPSDVTLSLERIKDIDTLEHWHEAALTTSSLSEFGKALVTATTTRALVPRT